MYGHLLYYDMLGAMATPDDEGLSGTKMLLP